MRLNGSACSANDFDFNPRIPYGMRPDQRENSAQDYEFQSTHPVWDATVGGQAAHSGQVISIHASRMGCDNARTVHGVSSKYFNPRIPYGMRLCLRKTVGVGLYFNPRIPYGMRRRRC